MRQKQTETKQDLREKKKKITREMKKQDEIETN